MGWLRNATSLVERARLPEVLKRLEEHAAVLAELSSARTTQIIERELPQPLSERGPGAFIWPLGKEPLYRSGSSQREEEARSPMERRHTNTYVRKYLDGKYVVTNSAEGNPVEEEAEAEAEPAPTAKKAGKKKSGKGSSQAQSA